MMDVEELEERFRVPGVLGFEKTASGLVFARVTTPQAAATVYLQGAHLAHWKPVGQAPMLFLSARSELLPGRPIRGGVPVIFPWFGPRHDGKTGPPHGFARTEVWNLAFAAMAGEDLDLTFTLAPNEVSRALGFDHFRLAYRMTIGRRLTLELTVANDSGSGGSHAVAAGADTASPGAPLLYEEALHTYFAIADIARTTLSGLEGTAFLDKVDDMRAKVQPDGPLVFTGRNDRVYLNTTATCAIDDAAGKRRIVVEKTGSQTTVVWNPWAEVAATLADMEPEGWRRMLCVETANAGGNAVSLKPGATHTMRAGISVEGLA